MILAINSAIIIMLIIILIINYFIFGHRSKYYNKKNKSEELNYGKFDYVSKLSVNGKELVEELKYYYGRKYKHITNYQIIVKNEKKTNDVQVMPSDDLEKKADHQGDTFCFGKKIQLNCKFAYDINPDIVQDSFHEIKHAIDEKILKKSFTMLVVFLFASIFFAVLMVIYNNIFTFLYFISICGGIYSSYFKAMTEYSAVTFVPKAYKEWVDYKDELTEVEKLELFNYFHHNANNIKKYYPFNIFNRYNSFSLLVTFLVEVFLICKAVFLP